MIYLILLILNIATAKDVRKLLIAEILDVRAGLLKLLLVIEHIYKPAPTCFILSALSSLSTQHSALSTFL